MRSDYKKLLKELDYTRLPKHVGIIMDGNGRWAKLHHRHRLWGHRAGAKSVRAVVELAGEIHLPYLTVYAFSTENWNRPADEVNGLMNLLWEFVQKEVDEINRNNVVARIIGSKERVDPEFLDRVNKVLSKTWNNTGLHFQVAFNYGGRQEIIEAIKSISCEVLAGNIVPSEINQNTLQNYLYTKDIPDPDLIIRTSGEMRLSNFFIWQAAYAELYVTDTLWPDFNKEEFIKALLDYQKRERRFGGV